MNARWILFLMLVGLTVAAETKRYRLSWRDDPATTVVVGWEQNAGGPATVHYGFEDFGTDAARYPFARGVDRASEVAGGTHCFSRLQDLPPGTTVYFVIRDADGTSGRFWFRTAPDSPSSFSFVAGGDSRNNRKPRQQANDVVAKLRPLFVTFGGDFTGSAKDQQWKDWLDDWQRTITPDGKMTPIIVARGNHDHDRHMVDLFDVPHPKVHYALQFGGEQLRVYTLNSETPAGGDQRAWLKRDLAEHGPATDFLVAHYHKPMRPHTRQKPEGEDEYQHWAPLFHRWRFDLVVECDSHTVKRTWPVVPSSGEGAEEGFVRNDEDGTVYIGEGCWGAPLRDSNDRKTWTRAAGRFNQVNWIHVHPEALKIRTVQVSLSEFADPVMEAHPFTVPDGMAVWTPDSGELVTIKRRAEPRAP